MRQDYTDFLDRDAEILAVGPDDRQAFQSHWEKEDIPFVGLADPRHTVADLYRQEVNLLKLGRMPALLVVDRSGQLRYQHYGRSMKDIPPNEEVLDLLDQINRDEKERRRHIPGSRPAAGS